MAGTNWPAPSFDPDTGLLYVGSNRTFAMFYLTDTDPRPEGWGGLDSVVGGDGGALLAIDYKTGKTAWRHDWPSGTGVAAMLSTAGKLLFTSNGNNLIAFDPANGKILWHNRSDCGPEQRSHYLYARWQAVPAGRRRRHDVLVRIELASHC